MQERVADLPLSPGPKLFIIEESTGGGKTEAALALAQRIMQGGEAETVFMALPTMATANALYLRLRDYVGKFFAPGRTPSLGLAHSQRKYVESFTNSINLSPHEPPKAPRLDEVFSEAQCAAWLADSGKKALLSSLGVGTVDQAVCAALPVRYQSLRVLGLCRGVLIIDEVHCYEAYLNELIGGLLEFMAGVGGSVILLSATLNRAQKEKMIERFWAGQGIERDAELVEVGYPLITMVQEGGAEEVAVGGPPPRDKKVRLEMLSDRQILLEHLTQASRDGACACWIRNTVDDARRGYEELKSALGRDRVLLFHARMAMQDRLDREEEVLRLFGKSSSPATRAGRVLVATQVVEQSLDLDFDLMASDLCPMDQIIQRVGRLFRHARPDRPYQNPRLLVLGPPAEAEPQKDWFRSFFPGASYVYPHHGQLWLSSRLLSSREELILPRQSRELIEQVFGPEAQENTPEALLAAEMDQEGRERADRSIAVSRPFAGRPLLWQGRPSLA